MRNFVAECVKHFDLAGNVSITDIESLDGFRYDRTCIQATDQLDLGPKWLS